jgi:hypothetical protein
MHEGPQKGPLQRACGQKNVGGRQLVREDLLEWSRGRRGCHSYTGRLRGQNEPFFKPGGLL